MATAGEARMGHLGEEVETGRLGQNRLGQQMAGQGKTSSIFGLM